MNILKTSNLKKYYGNGENLVKAIDNANIDIKEGEFVAIVGKSGSGKSTLLHMMGGLDNPTEGKVVSPINGTVQMIFKTKHAIGLKSEDGAEILIHIGMDTVQLEGKHFTPKVVQGAKVKKGEVLLEFDKKAIEAAGYSTITPVIVTNTADYLDVVETDKKQVNYNENLLTVIA